MIFKNWIVTPFLSAMLFSSLCAASPPSNCLEFDVIKIPGLPSAQEERLKNKGIKAVIFHCMGTSLRQSLDILTGNAGYQVSTHYFIPTMSGKEFLKEMNIHHQKLRYPERVPVIEIVSPDRMAYHAGKSSWGGVAAKSLNPSSIGIEVHCPGYANGLQPSKDWNFNVFVPYNDKQKETLVALTKYLKTQYGVDHFLAHSTVAPGRKTDPGPLFFWEDLNKLGYVTIVDQNKVVHIKKFKNMETPELIKEAKKALVKWGYTIPVDGEEELETLTKCIDSFFLQFDPSYWKAKNQEGRELANVNLREKVIRLLEGVEAMAV
ncbi:MAG: hypothetical protein C0582_03530 [Alphaproteobacteria bacterium]|nr:MAG: hypothetical protein C0582_03530 [Alphaproteobacteria bacterium]